MIIIRFNYQIKFVLTFYDVPSHSITLNQSVFKHLSVKLSKDETQKQHLEVAFG